MMGDSIGLQNNILWEDTSDLLKWLKNQVVPNWQKMFKVEVGKRSWVKKEKLWKIVSVAKSGMKGGFTSFQRFLWVKVNNEVKEESFDVLKQKKLQEPLAKRIKKKWNLLKGPKPDFFPFLLWCEWYEKMFYKNGYLAVVDWSKPSNYNRFYLIDMVHNKVEYTTTCEQWTWTEDKIGSENPGFSNKDGSHKTSLGISQTRQMPWNNFWIPDSLLVSWLERGFNSNSEYRKILVHVWTYSWGCFVFKDAEKWKKIIDKLANWGTIISYYPDANYLKNSLFVWVGR